MNGRRAGCPRLGKIREPSRAASDGDKGARQEDEIEAQSGALLPLGKDTHWLKNQIGRFLRELRCCHIAGAEFHPAAIESPEELDRRFDLGKILGGLELGSVELLAGDIDIESL